MPWSLPYFSLDFLQESKINYGVRSIFCILEKAEKGWWKKLLRGDEKTPHYVKVDWDKWVDEDEENGMHAFVSFPGLLLVHFIVTYPLFF